jgi:hypothetical protein
MAKTAGKSRKKIPQKPKPDIAKELAEALSEKPSKPARPADTPTPQVGDKVVLTDSKVGMVYEVSYVSSDGREVNLHLPGTNLERFRINPDDLTFVERQAPAKVPAKPAFDAEEIRERIASVQQICMDHLIGEIAILKKYLKSKRVPPAATEELDALCKSTEGCWETTVDRLARLLEE